MKIIYNEWDRPTAAWLSELGRAGAVPRGRVITKSITEIQAAEIKDARQFHAFAGIGGWPQALRLAGYENLPCWTGSPPCQPFSNAGQRRGKDDERHLAPVWLNLVREYLPPVLLGEQVEAAIRHGWLDDLFDALEDCGYACGAAVLPACSVGAPHIRKRLFFGAVRLDDAASARHVGPIYRTESETRNEARVRLSGAGRRISGMADANDTRPQGRQRVPERADEQFVGARGLAGRSAHSHHSGWPGADWLGCRDGKFRPVESQVLGMADGLPSGMVQSGIISASNPLAEKQEARVMRLRGYGNAIVPQVAATFVTAFMESIREV